MCLGMQPSLFSLEKIALPQCKIEKCRNAAQIFLGYTLRKKLEPSQSNHSGISLEVCYCYLRTSLSNYRSLLQFSVSTEELSNQEKEFEYG